MRRFKLEYFPDEVRISLEGPEVSGLRRGSMEMTKMDVRGAKARSVRKARPMEGGHKAKAARAAGGHRVPREVKAKNSVKSAKSLKAPAVAARPPIPANDTVPLSGEMVDPPVSALDELEREVVLGATPSADRSRNRSVRSSHRRTRRASPISTSAPGACGPRSAG